MRLHGVCVRAAAPPLQVQLLLLLLLLRCWWCCCHACARGSRCTGSATLQWLHALEHSTLHAWLPGYKYCSACCCWCWRARVGMGAPACARVRPCMDGQPPPPPRFVSSPSSALTPHGTYAGDAAAAAAAATRRLLTVVHGGVLDVADGGGVHDVAHDEPLDGLVLGHQHAGGLAPHAADLRCCAGAGVWVQEGATVPRAGSAVCAPARWAGMRTAIAHLHGRARAWPAHCSSSSSTWLCSNFSKGAKTLLFHP